VLQSLKAQAILSRSAKIIMADVYSDSARLALQTAGIIIGDAEDFEGRVSMIEQTSGSSILNYSLQKLNSSGSQ
jgi:hypothetical protein